MNFDILARMQSQLSAFTENLNSHDRLNQQVLFYQGHLDRVSRSFAFCIARLELSLRQNVGLTYLLCRILDTIEDAPWQNFSNQLNSFRQFEVFISQSDRLNEQEVKKWRSVFPINIVPDEARLLDDSYRLFYDFHQLPSRQRRSVARAVLSMSAGMTHYMGQKARQGKLELKNSSDVNRYCFFVAGVVGEMLTQFLTHEVKPSISRLRDSFRFGLFLQKVNILKDQKGDEAVGRFLVPSRALVLSGLIKDAEGAFRYLIGLPEKEVGFRLFCAWSLFLGLASLPFIQGLHGDTGKIPREDTLNLLCEIELKIQDGNALSQLFAELKPKLSESNLESQNEIQSEAGDEELLGLYQGDLPRQEVLALFSGLNT